GGECGSVWRPFGKEALFQILLRRVDVRRRIGSKAYRVRLLTSAATKKGFIGLGKKGKNVHEFCPSKAPDASDFSLGPGDGTSGEQGSRVGRQAPCGVCRPFQR